MCILEGVQSIKGYDKPIGGCHEDTRGCSLHWRDIISTSRTVQYIGGTYVDTIIHTCRYHNSCGGTSQGHRGIFSTSGFQYKVVFDNELPHMNHGNVSNVLTISFNMNNGIPPMY